MRAFLLAGLLFVATAAALAPSSPPASVTTLGVELPVRIQAGEAAEARIRADAPDGTPVGVLVIDALGTSRFSALLADGTAVVPLATSARRISGTVTVVATAGSVVALAHMEVAPTAVVDPVVPLLGARSIVADGADEAMLAVIPEDAFGNPQPDGTPVSVSIRRQDGTQAAWSSAVGGGVAWTWIPAGVVDGQTRITVSSGAGRGPAGYLQEVPGAPTAVVLTSDRPDVPADGRSLVVVETGELLDVNDNRLLDGTAVTFTITRPDSTWSLATAPVAGGRAATIIQAPGTPGTLVVRAAVGGVTSPALSIAVLPDAGSGDIPADISFTGRLLTVTVGPLFNVEASYVPDGTVITASTDDAVRRCRTAGGSCVVQFPPGTTGTLVLETGDATSVVEIGAAR